MLPKRYFGDGVAARLRKSVLMAIAKFANPDGTNAYPALQTLATMCFVSEKSVRTTIKWLEAQELLQVEYKKGLKCANRYTVIVPSDLEAQTSTSKSNGPGGFEGIPGSFGGGNLEAITSADLEAQTSNNRPYRLLKTPPTYNCPHEEDKNISSSQRHGQNTKGLKTEEATLLARELSFISRGTVHFLDKQVRQLARHLKEFTYEELSEVFDEQYKRIEDDPEQLGYLAFNFAQTADQHAYCRRRIQVQRTVQDDAKARKAAEMQTNAEQERLAGKEAREREQELVEELPD